MIVGTGNIQIYYITKSNARVTGMEKTIINWNINSRSNKRIEIKNNGKN